MPLLARMSHRSILLRGGGLLIAGVIFIWGFVAALPWFDLFATSPVYHTFQRFGPEWAWGVATMLLGGGQWWAIRTENDILLRWCAFILTLYLLFSALCYATSGTMSTASPIFVFFMWWNSALTNSTHANLMDPLVNPLEKAARLLRRKDRGSRDSRDDRDDRGGGASEAVNNGT